MRRRAETLYQTRRNMSDQLTTADSKKLVALEATIEEGLAIFHSVGSALLIIRNEKLYRGQYKTFAEYCDQKWHMDRSRAYQLMGSAQIVAALKMSTTVDILP